jgi:hypothetical protein
MVVNDFGYRKIIQIRGYSHEYLDSLSYMEIRAIRPDGSTFKRQLLPTDRDANKNFTWLIQTGELTVPGDYTLQAVGFSGDRQVATCPIKVHVCELLEA